MLAMDFKKIMSEMLDSLKKNEIDISTEFNNNSEITGKSKIGGRPYLPKNFIWPYYQGFPLSFLAQINLEEVNSFDKDKLLPNAGMLYFFYEPETEERGYNLQCKGCAKVFYYEDFSSFSLIDFPEDMGDDYKIPEFKVNLKSNKSFPSYEDFYLLLKEEKFFKNHNISFKDFVPIYSKLFIPNHNYTKLLGYPEVIQNSMEVQCAAVTMGFNLGNGVNPSKEYEEEIKKASKDWILLFQMDTIKTDDYELMFGDSGHIYFWIRRKDLANRNFENIWLILQCY